MKVNKINVEDKRQKQREKRITVNSNSNETPTPPLSPPLPPLLLPSAKKLLENLLIKTENYQKNET